MVPKIVIAPRGDNSITGNGKQILFFYFLNKKNKKIKQFFLEKYEKLWLVKQKLWQKKLTIFVAHMGVSVYLCLSHRKMLTYSVSYLNANIRGRDVNHHITL
jgi:hypothetical protein